jgi:hypothetical protein
MDNLCCSLQTSFFKRAAVSKEVSVLSGDKPMCNFVGWFAKRWGFLEQEAPLPGILLRTLKIITSSFSFEVHGVGFLTFYWLACYSNP